MDIWRSLGGMAELSFTSADPAATMSAIYGCGIQIHSATVSDDPLTIKVLIRRQDVNKVKALLERRGEILKSIHPRGMFWTAGRVFKRPVLLIGCFVFLVMAILLPTRIFFFRVDGNVTLPTKLILEKCEACGIGFGASRAEVRSEKLKNALLEALPQLQWAGINTSGCVATISVRERSVNEETKESAGVCSIVAARDGVIASATVTRGSAACKVGDVVTKGQVLISGYTDCGISIRAERAEGEIYALTEREICAVFPSQWSIRGDITRRIKKYSLIIGKKRINLYKDSGILDAGCVKMYSENYISLPGGFQLPFAVVTEVWSYADSRQLDIDPSDAQNKLSAFAEGYLPTQMIAGTVLQSKEDLQEETGFFLLKGEYACREMIGILRNEELVKPNE